MYLCTSVQHLYLCTPVPLYPVLPVYYLCTTYVPLYYLCPLVNACDPDVQVKQYLFSLYNCQYSEFFTALGHLEQVLPYWQSTGWPFFLALPP